MKQKIDYFLLKQSRAKCQKGQNTEFTNCPGKYKDRPKDGIFGPVVLESRFKQAEDLNYLNVG